MGPAFTREVSDVAHAYAPVITHLIDAPGPDWRLGPAGLMALGAFDKVGDRPTRLAARWTSQQTDRDHWVESSAGLPGPVNAAITFRGSPTSQISFQEHLYVYDGTRWNAATGLPGASGGPLAWASIAGKLTGVYQFPTGDWPIRPLPPGPTNRYVPHRSACILTLEDLRLPDVASPGPRVGADGQVTADDVQVFVNWFVNGDPRADLAGAGQTNPALARPDGALTSDDLIVFIAAFVE
jgi:hypothetical protein